MRANTPDTDNDIIIVAKLSCFTNILYMYEKNILIMGKE